jgi:sugar phosphate isomerase/epimerase
VTAASARLAALPGYPDLGPDDLILSHFSLGRHTPFPDRVAAAAGAGFAALSLYVGDYARLRDEGWSDAALRAVLDDHGVRVVELEALRGWSSTGAAGSAYLESERLVFAMADALGPAHHVQAIGPYEGSMEAAAAGFAALCDRAAQHGLGVALEFLPEMSNIPDAGAALELVELAGRPNGGLCVDVWHHYRGTADDELLRAVPADRVLSVQFNDGPRQRVLRDYRADCTTHRLPPGDGDFDLLRFLGVLAQIGVRLPLSVEVISADLQQRLPLDDLARLLAARTRAVVAAARVRAVGETGQQLL